MFLNKSTYWALKALVYLASQPPAAAPHLSSEVAAAVGAPAPATAKVLRRLALAGILVSLRGSGGGFMLAQAPDDLTVFDVYQAMDGKSYDGHQASGEAPGLEAFLSTTQHLIIAAMRDTTISALAKAGDGTPAGLQ